MILNIFMKLSFFIIFCFQNSIQSFKNNYNPFMIYKLNNIVSKKKFSNKKAYNSFYKKDYNKKTIFHIKKLFYNNSNNINDYYNFIKKQDNKNTTLIHHNVNDTISNNGNSSDFERNNILYLNNIYDFTNFLKHKYD